MLIGFRLLRDYRICSLTACKLHQLRNCLPPPVCANISFVPGVAEGWRTQALTNRMVAPARELLRESGTCVCARARAHMRACIRMDAHMDHCSEGLTDWAP